MNFFRGRRLLPVQYHVYCVYPSVGFLDIFFNTITLVLSTVLPVVLPNRQIVQLLLLTSYHIITIMATTIRELFTPYVLQVGVSFMMVHMILYTLFVTKVFGIGPWSILPSYTAHKIITFPALIYLSIHGLLYFDFREIHSSTLTPFDRVILQSPHQEHLTEFMFAMMVFWDVPAALLTPALRQSQMILHHIGMITLTAFSMGIFSNGVTLFGYYIPFFFGFIEISSVPLTVVDLFHPRHKAWNAYLTSEERPKWMMTMNKRCRIIFASLFMLVRTIAFPYVSAMGVMMDVAHLTSLPLDQRRGVPNFPLIVMTLLNVLFSALQVYWGSLVLPQLWKVLVGSTKATMSKTKNI